MPTERTSEAQQTAGESADPTNADKAGPKGRHREPEGSGADETTEEVDEREAQLIALKFGANKSLRYHAARRLFFDRIHRGGMAVAAIGGSAAFVALIGGGTVLATFAAAIIAVAASLDVAIGFSERARHHDELYRRWSDLVAEMIRHGPPEEQVLRNWMAERTLIEKEKPTPLAALNVICHNEEAEVQGYGDDQLRHVRWPQRLFCHLFTFPPNNFPTFAERRQRPRRSRWFRFGPAR